MQINTSNLVSITEANQNFSRVARLVDENGVAVILKNNTPRYVLIEFSQFQNEEFADDATIQ
jgi:antitoxin Phd